VTVIELQRELDKVTRERDIYKDALQYLSTIRVEEGYKATLLRAKDFARTMLENRTIA
jgi:hypothetical protein